MQPKPERPGFIRVLVRVVLSFLSSPERWWRHRFFWSALQLGIGGAIGAIVLALVSAGAIYEYQDSVDGVHLPPVDAIVCLAGGRGRIAASGDLWYRYFEAAEGAKPPVLYLSGMGRLSTWGVLARQVRPGVLSALKPEHVILETESLNTEENALFMVKHASERRWKRILLVTSRYHMRRAKTIFSRVLQAQKLPLKIETLSVYQEPFEPGEWLTGLHGIRVTLTEYFKFLYYESFWKPAGEI